MDDRGRYTIIGPGPDFRPLLSVFDMTPSECLRFTERAVEDGTLPRGNSLSTTAAGYDLAVRAMWLDSRRAGVDREEIRDGRIHRWLTDGRHLVLNAWGWEDYK